MAALTAQTSPYIYVAGIPPRLIYQSLDATDEVLYNQFDKSSNRNAFLQMISDWKNEVNELGGTPPTTGAEIQTRWNQKRIHLIKVWNKRRPRHAAALIAVPHPPALSPQTQNQARHDLGQTQRQTRDQAAVAHTASAVMLNNNYRSLSPIHSPLAELSPRFVCQNKWPAHTLSPTRGQSNAITEDLHGDWRYGDVIYQETSSLGSHAAVVPLFSVYLYVRPDDTGTIQEQVAVKCLEINEMTEQKLEEFSQDAPPHQEFDKNAIHEGYEQNVKTELDICQRVRLTRCSHMARYRGYGMRDSTHTVLRPGQTKSEAIGQKSVHLYHSLADRGDLNNLIWRHEVLQRPINEHFIWYTMRELTEALVALKYGPGSCTSAREQPVDTSEAGQLTIGSSEPWVPILHPDIKPMNVLFEAPRDSAEYPTYPKPILCDFGLSQLASDEFLDGTTEDALDYRFSGTKGWLPPERSSPDYDPKVGSFIDEGYHPHIWRLSEKTDVWGLGLLAYRMMHAHLRMSLNAHTLSDVSEWAKEFRDPENLQCSHYKPSFSLGPEDYSTGLHQLAFDCLWHDMRERPDLLELRKRTNAGMARLEGLYGENIKKRKRDPEDALNIFTCGRNGPPFAKFEIGKKYQPKRKLPRLELDEDSLDHFEFGKMVRNWDNLDPKPRVAAQDVIAERIGFYLLHAPQVKQPDVHNAKAWEWSTKHLISCLRKRISKDPICYVLTHLEIVEEEGMAREASIDIEAFEIDIKLDILEYLRDEPSLQTDRPVVATGASSVTFLKHVIEWALFLVSKCHEEDRVVEPKSRGQELQDLSYLHQGLFDWIFVKPSGAFVKS